MNDSSFLYRIADAECIPVIPFQLPETGSLCVQSDSGKCYIGIDSDFLDTESEKKVHLGHELGHCVTGSFYNRYAALDVRQKHENRADKWAIEHLVPKTEFDEAVCAGFNELWSLSEYFDVSEDFMRKAVCWYTHGNLAVDTYV